MTQHSTLADAAARRRRRWAARRTTRSASPGERTFEYLLSSDGDAVRSLGDSTSTPDWMVVFTTTPTSAEVRSAARAAHAACTEAGRHQIGGSWHITAGRRGERARVTVELTGVAHPLLTEAVGDGTPGDLIYTAVGSLIGEHTGVAHPYSTRSLTRQ